MTVAEVIVRIDRMNRITDSYDSHGDIAPMYFEDIIKFIEEYRDSLLNKKIG